MLFSVYSVCQLIGTPILGAISDRKGRRPVLVFSQAGSVIGYLLLGFATARPWSAAVALSMIYLSRVIDGFTGGNISTAQAYISDITTDETRAKGMGMLGAAFGIGFTLGPFIEQASSPATTTNTPVGPPSPPPRAAPSRPSCPCFVSPNPPSTKVTLAEAGRSASLKADPLSPSSSSSLSSAWPHS